MQETLQAILEEVRKKAPLLSARAEFEAYKATISGPNGALTQAMKEMGRVPKEEKPALGRLINEVKGQITTLFDEVVERIVAAELSEKLGPAIDPTLPLPDPNRGTLHPIAQVREEIISLFRRIGFSVAEATEVETEHYCFDALNIPGSSGRDMRILLPAGQSEVALHPNSDEKHLLRTHTSTVQIRTMPEEKPPFALLFGRCFRRDTPDATHS